MKNKVAEKLIICSGSVVNGMAFTITFTFGSLLVQKLGMAEDRSSTGFWVGILAFSMMGARALFSPVWGMICDRWGRKLSALCGISAVIVFSTTFGLTQSYWWAVISRFLIGGLCCIQMVNISLMVEISNSDPGATGWLVIAWQSGQILGNIVGGMLVDPYESGLSDWEIFKDFPFLLPNLILSVIATFSLIAYALFITEPRKSTNQELATSSRSVLGLIRDKKILINLTLYFIWMNINIGFQEIMPLYCWASKNDGGLGLTTIEIGNIQGVSVILLLFLEAPFYRLLRRYMNIVKLTKCGCFAGGIILFLVPLCTVFNDYNYVVYVCLAIITNCWWVISFFMDANLVTMQNNCVGNSERGKMNGILATSASMAKGVSPLTLGYMFAETTKSNLG